MEPILSKGQLGTLRFEASGDTHRVMAGTLRCPKCAGRVEVVLRRNPNAVTEKQPAFLFFDARQAEDVQQLGHLFVGTKPKSPVLYFGAINHCGVEQRVVVFFNRAFRVSTDPHFLLVRQVGSKGMDHEDTLF
jgi:hypothetical protein